MATFFEISTIFKTYQFFKKFSEYFLGNFENISFTSSKFLYTFIFLRLKQNFLKNKKLYLKFGRILLIIPKIF